MSCKQAMVCLSVAIAVLLLLLGGTFLWINEGFPGHVAMKEHAKLFLDSGIDAITPEKPSALPKLHVETPLGHSRSCLQCAGGHFLMRRWLMQDSSVHQQMGFPEDWYQTDCLSGKMNRYDNCKSTCMVIWIQRQQFLSTMIYDSVVMDCADDLIFSTPDIPDMRYRAHPGKATVFAENATYVSDRSEYRITYQFNTLSSDTRSTVSRKLRDYVVAGLSPVETTDGTYWVYAIAVGALAIVFICLGCSFSKNYGRKDKHRVSESLVIPYRNPALEQNAHSPSSSSIAPPFFQSENECDEPSDENVGLNVTDETVTYRRADVPTPVVTRKKYDVPPPPPQSCKPTAKFESDLEATEKATAENPISVEHKEDAPAVEDGSDAAVEDGKDDGHPVAKKDDCMVPVVTKE